MIVLLGRIKRLQKGMMGTEKDKRERGMITLEGTEMNKASGLIKDILHVFYCDAAEPILTQGHPGQIAELEVRPWVKADSNAINYELVAVQRFYDPQSAKK